MTFSTEHVCPLFLLIILPLHPQGLTAFIELDSNITVLNERERYLLHKNVFTVILREKLISLPENCSGD